MTRTNNHKLNRSPSVINKLLLHDHNFPFISDPAA